MTPVAAPESMPGGVQSRATTVPAARGRRPSSRSERSLIRGALAGSQTDLEVLFRRQWPRAYRAAVLIVHDHAAAEDIAQEAFLSPEHRAVVVMRYVLQYTPGEIARALALGKR